MDGRDLLRRFAARRYLVLIAVVLAVIIGAAVFVLTPGSYTAQAGVLVVPPSTSPDTSTPSNPLTSLDSGVVQLASTLVYVAQSPQAVAEISARSNGGSATVINTTNDPSNNTPFLQITGSGSSAGSATEAAQAVIDLLNTSLTNMQNSSSVPKYLLMRLDVVVSPAVASQSTSGRLKAGGLTGAVVLIVGLVGVALADRYLRLNAANANGANSGSGRSWSNIAPTRTVGRIDDDTVIVRRPAQYNNGVAGKRDGVTRGTTGAPATGTRRPAAGGTSTGPRAGSGTGSSATSSTPNGSAAGGPAKGGSGSGGSTPPASGTRGSVRR